MIIPDPETVLYAGDEVIVLAMVESERAIQTILVGDALASAADSDVAVDRRSGAGDTGAPTIV